MNTAQPRAHGARFIILALDERTAALVANAVLARFLVKDVERHLAGAADASAGKPVDDLFVRYVKINHAADLAVEVVQNLFECLGLRRGARKAVEH
jgi:hypothetical protein